MIYSVVSYIHGMGGHNRSHLSLLFISLFLFFTRIRKALENKNNMEDDRVAILEAQLAQAKLIAEEADKKYEEVKSHNMRTHAL